MSKKTIELDVDFIGGQNSLTKTEEEAISEFLKTKKLLRAKNTSAPKKSKRTVPQIRKKAVV